MLGRLTLILSVAAWEFRRFYKLRDQLLSLGLAVLGGVVGLGVQHFVGVWNGGGNLVRLEDDVATV